MRTTNPANNVVLTSLGSFIDGPTGNGTIEVYDSDPAVSVGAPPGGSLMGILTFSRPSYQNPFGGYMDSYTISPEISALVAGTMKSFIIKNSSGTIVADGTIGLLGVDTGKDIYFDVVVITLGDPIIITNLRIAT